MKQSIFIKSLKIHKCNVGKSVATRNFSTTKEKDLQSLLNNAWQVETPSGLKYRDVRSDNGIDLVEKQVVASIGDKVSIHYSGYLPSLAMKVFDSSLPRGKPISFTLGSKMVIMGWEEGILGMKEGGRRHLLIPPHLGYGYDQVGNIPSGSVLLFDCELLKIEKTTSLADKIKSLVMRFLN